MMTKVIGSHQFHTSEDVMNKLYAQFNERRAGTKFLSVAAEDLWSLLRDHSEMAAKFTEATNGTAS